MFSRETDYPTAVASYDDGGVGAAIKWCLSHMQQGEHLSVWTSLKSNLENCEALEELVTQYSDVDHIVERGGGMVRHRGPVLMAWADMDDIGKLVRFGSKHITALCVIAYDEDRLRPWVESTNATVLGNRTAWTGKTPSLDPLLEEALKSMTSAVNHNNTVLAGFEKDTVVSILLALHDGGIWMQAEPIQAWALAHGWSGDNPKHLAKYVDDINSGKRPRTRRHIPPGYLDRLRERIAEAPQD